MTTDAVGKYYTLDKAMLFDEHVLCGENIISPILPTLLTAVTFLVGLPLT